MAWQWSIVREHGNRGGCHQSSSLCHAYFIEAPGVCFIYVLIVASADEGATGSDLILPGKIWLDWRDVPYWRLQITNWTKMTCQPSDFLSTVSSSLSLCHFINYGKMSRFTNSFLWSRSGGSFGSHPLREPPGQFTLQTSSYESGKKKANSYVTIWGNLAHLQPAEATWWLYRFFQMGHDQGCAEVSLMPPLAKSGRLDKSWLISLPLGSLLTEFCVRRLRLIKFHHRVP